MSIFASNEPVPKAETIADTVSTDTYDKEQRVGSIPSLTLRPDGKERSVMSLHFPGVWLLGTTSSRLHCTSRATLSGRGPRDTIESVFVSDEGRTPRRGGRLPKAYLLRPRAGAATARSQFRSQMRCLRRGICGDAGQGE